MGTSKPECELDGCRKAWGFQGAFSATQMVPYRPLSKLANLTGPPFSFNNWIHNFLSSLENDSIFFLALLPDLNQARNKRTLQYDASEILRKRCRLCSEIGERFAPQNHSKFPNEADACGWDKYLSYWIHVCLCCLCWLGTLRLGFIH